MRSLILLRGVCAALVLSAGYGRGSLRADEPAAATSAPAGEECEPLRGQLDAAEKALTDRGPALQERLKAVAAALKALEAEPESVPASERSERRERLIAEQTTLQAEVRFLESAKTAWQAAADACESTARFREQLKQFHAGGEPTADKFVSGDVAAIQAQLEQLRSARAALEEPEAARAGRLDQLAELIENADAQAKPVLAAERAALMAESESARHKLAACDAERALLEARLTAARETVGEPPATQPETPTTAPAADEADALNKQRLAEQLDAEARDRLAFARSRLNQIESELARATRTGADTAGIENERAYWRQVEQYEQRRLQQAELHKRAAQQKEAIGQLRQRIEETRTSLKQLQRQRSHMTPQERREQAAKYREQADEARMRADGLDERASAEEKKIAPLQQRLPSLDALENALRERLAQAGSFDEYQRLLNHFRRMKQQYDAERQQIDLMVATVENIAYGTMRQATLERELADRLVQCADALVPPVPSFWERHRKIIHSIGIVAAVIALSYGVRLSVWLIRLVLAYVNNTLVRRHFSVKRIGTLLAFAASIVKLFLWIFGVVAVLNEFGIEPAKSTGAIGLIGLIMAGMFQQIVVDFVKGLDIIAGRHYNVGDFVEVDGKCGHVVDFSVKHTRIRTLSGQEFNIPNSRCVPSRRFPDGFVDNYVDITLKSRSDESRAKQAIDAVCPVLNQRVEAVRDEPALASRFAGPYGRVTLRYRVPVLPGCAWVVTDYFLPAVKEALAQEGIELASQPTFFFINRIETFRKLFSRRLSEEEIIRGVAQGESA